ncbi:MAG: helix-turn-helix domain-containing protein [Bacteroidota bacterium]|nr:helix-turn-helix domain-containing protein [Bacteroidota bacterium]
MPETDLSNADFQLALQFVNQTAQHIFLTGKAGTGKTTFLKYVRDHCSKKMAIVAPTGVAAINAGGVTMHSFFQLPFNPFIPGSGNYWDQTESAVNEQTLLKKVRFSASKKDLLQELDLLVIDEVSMLRADTLDAMDSILRFYRKRSLPFGGMQILFIGDLHQLPPVINKTEWEILRNHYASPFFFDAQVLKNCAMVNITLKKIYRQKDAAFIDLLNGIRTNQITENELTVLHKRHDPHFEPGYGEQYITLTTHNARADTINKQQLDKLSGYPYCFQAEMTGDFDPRSLIAEDQLFLKKGAQVMFVKNDKGENRRYFNGKIAVVSQVSQDEIRVRFPGENVELILEKETWRNIRYQYDREKETVEEETIGSFTQYPVRLAWAITIHKSQGLTFDKAIIDAGASFAPGQVYVALSRLTSLEGLILYSRIHPGSILTDPQVAAFSASEASSVFLQERLQQEQGDYVLRLIEEAFQWDKLTAVFRNHYVLRGNSFISERDEPAEWAKHILAKVEEEGLVCAKFGKQLTALMVSAKEDGYQSLQPRIEAACHYFLKVIDLLLNAVAGRKTKAKNTIKAKKYTKELNGLERTLLSKKDQLNQSLRMGEGLVKGLEVNSLFEMTKPTRPAVEEKTTAEKTPKLKKGETQRISLAMFKENKTIPEIAKLRSLSAYTVENHIVSFIGTGEINVHELVAEEKLNPILEAIRDSGDGFIGPIKEKLGGAFSWLEIKAVMNYRERSATSTTDA